MLTPAPPPPLPNVAALRARAMRADPVDAALGLPDAMRSRDAEKVALVLRSLPPPPMLLPLLSSEDVLTCTVGLVPLRMSGMLLLVLPNPIAVARLSLPS